MSQVIVVESRGLKTRGIVTDQKGVNIPLAAEVESAIQDGMVEIAKITSENTVDPTRVFLKHCSSCIVMGRQPFHTVNLDDKKLSEFSIKKDGKPHSQCKKCRSEQACQWQLVKAKERHEYQRTYQAKNPRPKRNRKMEKVLTAIEAGENTIVEKDTRVRGMDAMFTAVVKPKRKKKAAK